MIKCKYCLEEIPEHYKFCPHCEKDLRDNTQPKTPAKDKAGRNAIIGIILIALSFVWTAIDEEIAPPESKLEVVLRSLLTVVLAIAGAAVLITAIIQAILNRRKK